MRKRLDALRLMRSQDGGATWEQLESHGETGLGPQLRCRWALALLQAHPTDRNRAFRTLGCHAADPPEGQPLEQTVDRGQTWTTLFQSSEPAFPGWLAGGSGSLPSRFYLGAGRLASRGGGSLVFRGDDDGANWTELFAHHGDWNTGQPKQPLIRIGGLAYVPATPERVYVGVFTQAPGAGPARSQVQESSDGGVTWQDLGDLGPRIISAVAVGVDARKLYAATDRGLWRRPLSVE